MVSGRVDERAAHLPLSLQSLALRNNRLLSGWIEGREWKCTEGKSESEDIMHAVLYVAGCWSMSADCQAVSGKCFEQVLVWLYSLLKWTGFQNSFFNVMSCIWMLYFKEPYAILKWRAYFKTRTHRVCIINGNVLCALRRRTGNPRWRMSGLFDNSYKQRLTIIQLINNCT